MKKLLLDAGDGEPILLSDNLYHIRIALRWLAGRGDQDLAARCGPLADECQREEREAFREVLTETKLKKARAGESVRGEPVVILKSSDTCPLTYGDQVSLEEIDRTFKFKYPAAGLALQRAKKARTVVACLFKDREAAPKADSAGNIYEEDAAPSKEIRFCRLSDISIIAEEYPEAVTRWHAKNPAT